MMDNWVKKVRQAKLLTSKYTNIGSQMGYPVLTVTEKEGGILVRQDRFLESGPAEPKDNETLWYVHVTLN